MRRSKYPRKKSRKLFKKTAMRVHKKNYKRPMRGGYRI